MAIMRIGSCKLMAKPPQRHRQGLPLCRRRTGPARPQGHAPIQGPLAGMDGQGPSAQAAQELQPGESWGLAANCQGGPWRPPREDMESKA